MATTDSTSPTPDVSDQMHSGSFWARVRGMDDIKRLYAMNALSRLVTKRLKMMSGHDKFTTCLAHIKTRSFVLEKRNTICMAQNHNDIKYPASTPENATRKLMQGYSLGISAEKPYSPKQMA